MLSNMLHLLVLSICWRFTASAPLSSDSQSKDTTKTRTGKSLVTFFDYFQPIPPPNDLDYGNFVPESNDYDFGLDDNELSRTVPSGKRRLRPAAYQQAFNSPIYYIRLPPQPYMFVPGLGYVSQPPPPPPPPAPAAVSPFVNLPISFVSNGKPESIYQWAGGLPPFPAAPTPPPTRKPPTKPPATESSIHKLPGHYEFNGKPNDIYVLRDSYNSLYGDALQNFYP